jgi:hypothetical protein
LTAEEARQATDERTRLFWKVEETGKVAVQLRLESMGRMLEISSINSDEREGP